MQSLESEVDFKLDLTTDNKIYYMEKMKKNNIKNDLINLGSYLSLIFIIYLLSKLKKLIKNFQNNKDK